MHAHLFKLIIQCLERGAFHLLDMTWVIFRLMELAFFQDVDFNRHISAVVRLALFRGGDWAVLGLQRRGHKRVRLIGSSRKALDSTNGSS